MVLVKINTPVHYHVKNIEFIKTKNAKDQCHGCSDGIMVVSAGMAHIVERLLSNSALYMVYYTLV